MNFNSSELSNTINNIKVFTGVDDAGSIPYLVKSLAIFFSINSRRVKSEDSSLADVCQNLSDTLDTIGNKISEVASNIISEISSYAQQTLENETGTTQSIDNINAELESINTILAGI